MDPHRFARDNLKADAVVADVAAGAIDHLVRPHVEPFEVHPPLQRITDGRFEPVIDKLFADRDVDYLQINSTTAGCFTFRIERVTNGKRR